MTSADPHPPLILLSGVVKRFATAAGEFEALRGVDLTVDHGEFVAVVGKSGSGKSTLLNMIAGIDRPSEGSIAVHGSSLGQLSEAQLARWRGLSLGIVFQFFQLMPTLTALENVQLPMDFAGRGAGSAAKARARELLERMGLAEQADKLPAALSGGEQQRVAIARALANDPPLVVADEPTGNLDSATADQVFHLFEELVASGKTIVFVTHDRDLARRASRVLEIADGRIVGDHATAPTS
jgi:putative ABC transport system ATP-binding protein